jgi:hypothetical protein
MNGLVTNIDRRINAANDLIMGKYFLEMSYKCVFSIHNFYISVELSEFKELPYFQFSLAS